MPGLLPAPLLFSFSPHTKTPSQVGALIRALGDPSESPGRERGAESPGGERQEVGEGGNGDRDWFDKGGQRWLIVWREGGGGVYIVPHSWVNQLFALHCIPLVLH